MNSTSTLRTDFAMELSTAGRKMRTVFDALVRERGLTLSRARALLLLSRHPAMNQTELASALEIEKPTVVRLLDGLEKQGLIARSAVDGDRRAKQLTLTRAASEQVEELEAIGEHLRSTMLRGIDEADLAVAADVLRRLIRNIETMPS